ncbi:REG4 protein, partial [Corythaixoides concolor]|nr:REG4 protein [Corythaixoides concolor]
PSTGARYIDYCPEGWYYYKLNCFKYFSQLQSWDEAEVSPPGYAHGQGTPCLPGVPWHQRLSPQEQCQASQTSAHLAWVEEPQEATTLQKVISYYQRVQPVWLGLHYEQESQSWQWVNGDEYSVTSGLLGNGAQGGTCSVLTYLSGFTLWSSANCTQQHHFICKFTP